MTTTILWLNQPKERSLVNTRRDGSSIHIIKTHSKRIASWPPPIPNTSFVCFRTIIAVQNFLMEMVVRKDWSSAIEMWVFCHLTKGLKADTTFHVYLKSSDAFATSLILEQLYFASSSPSLRIPSELSRRASRGWSLLSPERMDLLRLLLSRGLTIPVGSSSINPPWRLPTPRSSKSLGFARRYPNR